MSTSKMKIDRPALQASHKTLHQSAQTAQHKTAGALKGGKKLSGTAGHKIFAAFVDGVLDQLAQQLPDDIERLIESYADGLLDLDAAAAEADRMLAEQAHHSGPMVISGSLGAASGIIIQGSSGAGLQGGSMNLQGSGSRSMQVTSRETSETASISTVSLGRGASPSAGPAAGTVGAGSGSLPDSGGMTAYKAKMRVGVRGYDQWGKAPYECTSWAGFRRSELGRSVPSGNGGAMGADPTLPPTLGAIASYGPGTDANPGHVMIVEQVYSPDRFRVSEMNYDLKGSYRDTQIWDRQPNGMWKAEQFGKVEAIKFTP